ncbi:MAG: phosphatase PAP2 family protein, partial [Firmicutes bacterium]|nr:phosphatase PAP2 family protein [Bacillota bacterium]
MRVDVAGDDQTPGAVASGDAWWRRPQGRYTPPFDQDVGSFQPGRVQRGEHGPSAERQGHRGLTEGAATVATGNAKTIIDAERDLHIYWEPRMQEFVLDYDWLTRLSNWIYIWWHWPVIIVVAVWLFLYQPLTYRRYRDAFVLSGAVGLVFFAAMPVAPPRIADPAIVDTIALHSPEY